MRTSLKSFIIFLVFFAQKSFADDYVSTNDVVKEIERTLIFDKSSRQQIDFYKFCQNVKWKSKRKRI